MLQWAIKNVWALYDTLRHVLTFCYGVYCVLLMFLSMRNTSLLPKHCQQCHKQQNEPVAKYIHKMHMYMHDHRL